jgi:LmbE family N-acetylglucosaminyl deacetylase
MPGAEPKKLVCIFAHPDDEVFGPGGTIACFSRTAEVHLICVTDGDAEPEFTNGKANGAELGQIRRLELKRSADILGVKSLTFLGYGDGSLCNNNYHEIAGKIKEVLEGIRPDSLLTLYLDGCSGHLDHVAVAMETSYLFEKLKYVKNIFYFVQKATVKKLIGSKYFVYHPPGFTKEEADWVHDIRPFYKTKLAAMKAHKSQLKDFALITTLFGKLLKTEMFKIISK